MVWVNTESMRIHRTFPGTVGSAEEIQRLLRNLTAIDALWFSKKDFLAFVRQNWITPQTLTGKKIFLEIGWGESFDDSQQLTPEILRTWKVEEVLVARGSEPDLIHWRDLSNHALVPLHLVIRPTELLDAQDLAQKLQGSEETSISFDFIPWGPSMNQGYSATDLRTLLQAFARALPAFRVKTFSGQDVLDHQAEPNLEL